MFPITTAPRRVVQVLGSIGVSAALSKSALLAGPALLYPIWGPWLRAGARNAELYLRQFRRLGLWRAQVIGVDIQVMPYAYIRQAAAGGGAGGAPYGTADSVSVVVGDPWPGGARAQLRFPYTPGCEELVAGESAEMLVLCRDGAFQSFKVVREVYFPQSGLWLADYPFVNRDVFLDVSLAVERGRQMQRQEAAEWAGGGGGGVDGVGVGFDRSGVGFGGGFGGEPGGFGAAAASPPPAYSAGGWAAPAYDVGAIDAAAVADPPSQQQPQQPQQQEEQQPQASSSSGDVLLASYRPVEDGGAASAAAAPDVAAGFSGGAAEQQQQAAVGGEPPAGPPPGTYYINEEGYAVPYDNGGGGGGYGYGGGSDGGGSNAGAYAGSGYGQQAAAASEQAAAAARGAWRQ